MRPIFSEARARWLASPRPIQLATTAMPRTNPAKLLAAIRAGPRSPALMHHMSSSAATTIAMAPPVLCAHRNSSTLETATHATPGSTQYQPLDFLRATAVPASANVAPEATLVNTPAALPNKRRCGSCRLTKSSCSGINVDAKNRGSVCDARKPSVHPVQHNKALRVNHRHAESPRARSSNVERAKMRDG